MSRNRWGVCVGETSVRCDAVDCSWGCVSVFACS